MTTTSESKLSMKLLIDTNAGKVLFAEADKDCVDFLFNILSLPVATVIKLLQKKGMNYGCLPNLYDSVENLNETYIQANQNKDVLLKPKSSVSGISSAPFLLLSDVQAQRTFYGCSYSNSHLTVSDDPNALCGTNCGHLMSRMLTYVGPVGVEKTAATKGGFVKEVVTYMVMDDLVVKPMSTISSISLLNKFNVKDVGVLQEQVVNFGMEEALKLLKACFDTKTVLTTVFSSHIKLTSK